MNAMMLIRRGGVDRFALWFAVLITALALGGCAVKFISSYDEQTDKDVTALQKKFETFFVKLEGLDGLPECTYLKQKSFYDEVKVDISAIKVRADAVPQNTITIEQVGLVSKNIDLLETIHKGKADKPTGANCISKGEIQPLRNAFNSSFTAILKLELAKKRGD